MNQHQARINLGFVEKTFLVTLPLISALGLAAILTGYTCSALFERQDQKSVIIDLRNLSNTVWLFTRHLKYLRENVSIFGLNKRKIQEHMHSWLRR